MYFVLLNRKLIDGTGRTQYQTRQASALIDRPAPYFDRTLSKRQPSGSRAQVNFLRKKYVTTASKPRFGSQLEKKKKRLFVPPPVLVDCFVFRLFLGFRQRRRRSGRDRCRYWK